MKWKEILLFTVLTTISGIVSAQKLSESLGSIKTDFEFYSDTIDLEVHGQFIIKNAGGFYSYDMTTGGYGMVYTSYHLEFSTYKELKFEYFKRHTNSLHYIIDFYNSDNLKLASIKFLGNKVSKITNTETKGSITYYSVDLYNIPISLLNNTKKLNIVEYREK